MFSQRQAVLWMCAGLLSAVSLVGCGPAGEKRVSVTGTVKNKGQILTVKPMVGRVQVTFIPVTAPGAPAADPQEAVVKPDGTFTVPGTDGKGIAPGKYKIAVRQWDEFPRVDTLQGAFDATNTPLEREITETIKIDIDVGLDP